MKSIQEKIAVMQAFADGKEIEFRAYGSSSWAATPSPVFNWHHYDYRVVFKPRTLFVIFRGDGTVAGESGDEQEAANRCDAFNANEKLTNRPYTYGKFMEQPHEV